MKVLGRHFIIDYHDCDPETLDSLESLERLMTEAARRTGATVLGIHLHPYAPHGISGVVVIAESHLSIHTWPEYGYAAVDIFTCGNEVEPELAVSFLETALGAGSHQLQELARGTFRAPRALV